MVTKAIDRLKSDRAECEATYRKMVLDLADGVEYSEDRIGVILSGSDRRLEDLDRHLRRAQDRQWARERLADAERIHTEILPEMKRRKLAIADQMQQLQREHEQKIQSLSNEHNRIYREMRAKLNELGAMRRDARETLHRTGAIEDDVVRPDEMSFD